MSVSLKTQSKRWVKGTLGRNRFFALEMFTVYPYMFDPDQLIFIANAVVEQSGVEGCYLEVGCARGAGTAFLNRLMMQKNIHKVYYALDTFEGFPDSQSAYEIDTRGKPPSIRSSFKINKKSWVHKSLELADVRGVKLIQGDAAAFDYGSLGPVAWCLLDVDLYLPIAAALPKIYARLAPGGIIIVDDCQEDERWDGAFQAFKEFVNERGLPETVVHRKLGVIRKR